MSIKEQVIALWETSFEEVLEEKCACPKCKNKKSVSRRIIKEPDQKWAGRWYVEYCMNGECPYWDCGFLPRKYKPKPTEEYKWISEKPKKRQSSREKDQQ